MGYQEFEPWMLAVMTEYSEGHPWKEVTRKHNVQDKLYRPQAYGSNAIGSIIIPEKCDMCHSRQVGRFASRDAFSLESQWDKNTYCISCDHKPFSNNCNCKHCKKIKHEQTKVEEQKHLHARELEQIEIRKQVELHNNNTYEIDGVVDISRLPMLLALLEQSNDEDPWVITPTLASDPLLAPSIKMSADLVGETTSFRQLVDPCPKSASIQDGSLTWHRFEEKYRLTGKCQDPKQYLLSELTAMAFDDELTAEMLACRIGDLMLEEALEFLREKRSSFKLPHHVGDKTILLFKRLIVERTLGEIFFMIWKACTDCAAQLLTEGMSKGLATNLIIGNIERFHLRARDQGWKLASYKRFEYKKQNWLSYVYFNLILQLPGDGLGYTLLDVVKKMKLDQSDDCPYSLAEEYPHAFDALCAIKSASSNEEALINP